jgi:hypothetical protein
LIGRSREPRIEDEDASPRVATLHRSQQRRIVRQSEERLKKKENVEPISTTILNGIFTFNGEVKRLYLKSQQSN